jgi:hypothetical protein
MKKNQIVSIFFSILILALSVTACAQSGIDKKVYYNVMASGQGGAMDAQLKVLKNLSGVERDAFEGALLMKKSGGLTIPAKKLSMFKQGYKKLEDAIAKNSNNVEFRFLRLMVQENAPKALGYNKNIKQDSNFIKANYKNLSATIQQFIINYSHISKALKDLF